MSKENLQLPLDDFPSLCVCVPSFPFNNNNRRGPTVITLPRLSKCALLLWQYLTGSPDVSEGGGVAATVYFTHPGFNCVFLLLVEAAFSCNISLLIWTHHSLQHLNGNPLVRTTMHVGAWEDCPDFRCWNTNAAGRKHWRIAVSCCRC